VQGSKPLAAEPRVPLALRVWLHLRAYDAFDEPPPAKDLPFTWVRIPYKD
jgi:hypothetical protein